MKLLGKVEGGGGNLISLPIRKLHHRPSLPPGKETDQHSPPYGPFTPDFLLLFLDSLSLPISSSSYLQPLYIRFPHTRIHCLPFHSFRNSSVATFLLGVSVLVHGKLMSSNRRVLRMAHTLKSLAPHLNPELNLASRHASKSKQRTTSALNIRLHLPTLLVTFTFVSSLCFSFLSLPLSLFLCARHFPVWS